MYQIERRTCLSEDDFQIQKISKVDRADVLRFEDINPEHGAWTWFIRECLTRYVSLYDETPTELVGEVVTTLFDEHQKKVRHRNEY